MLPCFGRPQRQRGFRLFQFEVKSVSPLTHVIALSYSREVKMRRNREDERKRAKGSQWCAAGVGPWCQRAGPSTQGKGKNSRERGLVLIKIFENCFSAFIISPDKSNTHTYSYRRGGKMFSSSGLLIREKIWTTAWMAAREY